MIEYCLGFVYDSSLASVVLIQKEAGLHVGMWNGLGGKVEEGETPLEAMRREYSEEAPGYEMGEWDLIGFINGDRWQVHVFAAVDTDCVDTLTASDILRHGNTPQVAQVLLEGIDKLSLASHTREFINFGIYYFTADDGALLTITGG